MWSKLVMTVTWEAALTQSLSFSMKRLRSKLRMDATDIFIPKKKTFEELHFYLLGLIFSSRDPLSNKFFRSPFNEGLGKIAKLPPVNNSWVRASP